MANLQEHTRKKTEEILVPTKSKPSEVSTETYQSTNDAKKSQFDSLKLDVIPKQSQNQSLSDYVYDKFFSWVEGPIKITSESVAEIMKPVVDTAFRYLKTIDLDKIERDMTTYTKDTLKLVIAQSSQVKEELEKFLNDKPEAGKPVTAYDSFRSYCKYAYDKCCEYAPKVSATVMGVVDYVGESALGQENYKWARDGVYNTALRIIEAFQKAYKSLTTSLNQELETENKIAAIGVLDTGISDGDRQSAIDAIGMLSDIVSFSENYFGNPHKDFFSHRITDSEDQCDGIRSKQPETIRPELSEDMDRPVFDPFPNYVNRAKDARENEDKAKYTEVTGESFVRVGIDNELSNIDKLKILTTSQKKVA